MGGDGGVRWERWVGRARAAGVEAGIEREILDGGSTTEEGGSQRSWGRHTWSPVAPPVEGGRGQRDRYRSRAREGARARRGRGHAPRHGHGPAPPALLALPPRNPALDPPKTSPLPWSTRFPIIPSPRAHRAGPAPGGEPRNSRFPPQKRGFTPAPGTPQPPRLRGTLGAGGAGQGAAGNVRDPPGVTPSAHPRIFGSAAAV